jgi:ribonucleotide monophosphatase NagD (HAD superfamily)
MKTLSATHRVWFCDIWGVVHDGYKPFKATTDVLAQHRENGGVVVLVTNSPRTALGVETQLAEIGLVLMPLSHLVT